MNINRTIIIPAALAPLARALAAAQSAGGIGMFETPLYTGTELTHYISSGQIDEQFDAMLPMYNVQITKEGTVATPPTQAFKDAAANLLLASGQGLVTLPQCQALVDGAIVVDCDIESAQATFDRLRLTVGNNNAII